SFNVLDQLLDLFQGALDLDDVAGNLDVAGLGTDGVGLSEHLLRQELQLSASALLVPDDLLELLEVAGQADDLLGDVAALGEDRHFLDKIATVQLDVQFAEQAANAVQQAVAVGGDDLRRALADGGQLLAYEVAQ